MQSKPTRFYSTRQEKAVAKVVLGKRTPNSGAIAFSGGDVTTDDWLIECKTATSEKSSFLIKRDWLDKNKQEAISMRKSYNALCFDFGDNGKRYYIIDERTFKQLLQFTQEVET